MRLLDLESMSQKYRQVRKDVFEKATCPDKGSRAEHESNKSLFRAHVEKFCLTADLNLYQGTDEKTAATLWRHMWTKIRYSGFKSVTATKEIKHIAPHFDDYRFFCRPDWEPETGDYYRNFLEKKGLFDGLATVANRSKLKKTVALARSFADFMSGKHPSRPCLHFLTGGHTHDDPWAVHQRLQSIGYRGHLTALHLMMELGFNVIKPDIVISSLFLEWGWLHEVIPDLPKDLEVADLHGKGQHGGKWRYDKPQMYKPAIDLARRIARATMQQDLIDDIGWATNNPLREFDVFVVKFGQIPEPQLGIIRTLKKTKSCSLNETGEIL